MNTKFELKFHHLRDKMLSDEDKAALNTSAANGPSNLNILFPNQLSFKEAMNNDIYRFLTKEFLSETLSQIPYHTFNTIPSMSFSEDRFFEHWTFLNKDVELMQLVKLLDMGLQRISKSQSKFQDLLIYDHSKPTFFCQVNDPKDFEILQDSGFVLSNLKVILPKKTLLFMDIRYSLKDDTKQKVIDSYSHRLPEFLEKIELKPERVSILIIYNKSKQFEEEGETCPVLKFKSKNNIMCTIEGQVQLNMDGLYKGLTGLSDTNILTLFLGLLKSKEENGTLVNPPEHQPNFNIDFDKDRQKSLLRKCFGLYMLSP